MTVSPAQAVWVAYEDILENECVVTDTDKKALAAAIRAAVDQVVPKDVDPLGNWTCKDEVRYQFLAIATELESL
jgi:hypothetical protein